MVKGRELKVVEVRRSKGLSQSELARRVGCTQSSLSRIEHGLEPPYPIRGQKIADALEWEGDYKELFEPLEVEQ